MAVTTFVDEDVMLERSVAIPMRDDVLLYADVWRPATDQPVPVLVSRTPYGRDMLQMGFLGAPPADLVRAAYAVVYQTSTSDLRRRWTSSRSPSTSARSRPVRTCSSTPPSLSRNPPRSRDRSSWSCGRPRRRPTPTSPPSSWRCTPTAAPSTCVTASCERARSSRRRWCPARPIASRSSCGRSARSSPPATGPGSISSSNHPHFEPNSNCGKPVGTDTDGDIRSARQMVFHDALHPSGLILPVIGR